MRSIDQQLKRVLGGFSLNGYPDNHCDNTMEDHRRMAMRQQRAGGEHTAQQTSADPCCSSGDRGEVGAESGAVRGGAAHMEAAHLSVVLPSPRPREATLTGTPCAGHMTTRSGRPREATLTGTPCTGCMTARSGLGHTSDHGPRVRHGEEA